MASIQPPSSNVYSTMREMHWSPRENTIARRAFDRALHQELDATIQKAKQMAERIKKPDELWELERLLTSDEKRSTGNTSSSIPRCCWFWLSWFGQAVSAWMNSVAYPTTSCVAFGVMPSQRPETRSECNRGHNSSSTLEPPDVSKRVRKSSARADQIKPDVGPQASDLSHLQHP